MKSLKQILVFILMTPFVMYAKNKDIFVLDFGKYKVYTNTEYTSYKIVEAKTKKVVLENLQNLSITRDGHYLECIKDSQYIYLDYQLNETKERLSFDFGKGIVYQNPDKTYKIIDENKNILYSNLKFAGQIYNGAYYQLLDKDKNILYINQKLQQASTLDKSLNYYEHCGNEMYYTLEIEQQNNNYIIKKTSDATLVSSSDEVNTIKTKSIDTFSNKDIEKAYFLNKKKKITFINSENISEIIILEYSNKSGIRQDGKTIYFDVVEIIENNLLKVEKEGLYGYYNIIKPKYKALGNFHHNLAKFTTTNNITGYLDFFGNEYL